MNTFEKKLRMAEEALHKNMTFLDKIEYLADAGGWDYDTATRQLTWTSGIFRIFGVKPGTFDPNEPGKALEFYPPADRRKITEAFEKAISEGIPYDLVLNVIKATGEHIIVRTKAMAEIQEGRVVRVTGYLKDITDLKRADDDLRRTHDLQLAILNNTHVLIACLDTEFNFIVVNENYARADGKHPDFFPGRNHFSLFPNAENEVIFRRVLETGEPYFTTARPFEYVEHPERGLTHWDWSLKAVRNDTGQVIMLVLTLLDVISRVQAEEALRQSRERLKKVLEVDAVGVMFWDLSTGCLVDANDTFLKMMGYSRVEVEACNLSWRDFTPEEYHQVSLDEIKKFRETGHVGPYEKEYFHKDGTRQWLLFSGSSLGGDSCVEFCIDISDRKRIEGELKKYNEKLEAAVRIRTEELNQQHVRLREINEELLRSNRELENFAYVASHDLQEPLRMVTSFTQMLSLKYKDQLDDDAKDYIKYAVDGAKRMYDLINGLLDYSRISRKGLDFIIVDTNEIIEVVKANLRLVISDRNCIIETHLLPEIHADRNQMIQLFQNLVNNGIKFNTNDPRIRITAKKENSNYLFSIQDNGIGIEPDYHNKIFEIFKRLNPRDQFEGTGIGLAICKRIVENHNGKIWLESIPGDGSVFYFTLPAAK